MKTLNQYLNAKGITQEAFAEDLGITQATVSRICRGKAEPSKSLMLEIDRKTDGMVPVLSWFQSAAE